MAIRSEMATTMIAIMNPGSTGVAPTGIGTAVGEIVFSVVVELAVPTAGAKPAIPVSTIQCHIIDW
jgi:hypothetical protein